MPTAPPDCVVPSPCQHRTPPSSALPPRRSDNGITNGLEIYNDRSAGTVVMAANNDAQLRLFAAAAGEGALRPLARWPFEWAVNYATVRPGGDGNLAAVVGDDPATLITDVHNGAFRGVLERLGWLTWRGWFWGRSGARRVRSWRCGCDVTMQDCTGLDAGVQALQPQADHARRTCMVNRCASSGTSRVL